MDDPQAEILRLRAALRDLVALSAIPAAWVGREPHAIAFGLADVLLGSLGLDFAFVRLCDPKGSTAVEVMRGDAWKEFPEWLERQLAAAGQFSRKEIVPGIGGDEPCCGVVIPIGVNAEGGLVAAACSRTGFPTEIDQLLLSVAANHAATAFQNARLIHERRSAEEELRKARNELEMKVAERTAELKRSEAYLAEAQKLTRTGSWAGSVTTHQMLHSSEEHSRMYGFDPAKGVPSFEEFLQRIHPEDRARVLETVEKASHAGTDFEANFRVVLPDGTTRYMQAVGHPAFSVFGDRGEFGTLMDVTERRQADEERERLRQAQADLAHVTRMTTMGELTASLAHEIKQPITAAVTNAKTCLRWLTRERPDVEEAREAASRIVKDTTRAADIISGIRLLFKKGAPQRETVDISEIIREMVVLLRNEAARHSISIRTELDADLPTVMADRVQLQQVFMNIMLNGIDAMNHVEGTRELTVKVQRGKDEHLLVLVSDTGVGLPAEQADRIFNAFFTTKTYGTGMGLPISRSIVESHGGRLWATANSDRGATFYFTLPCELERASSPQSELSRQTA
jgi:C4-dicarboxylate-specific signal transduction histidine kinase